MSHKILVGDVFDMLATLPDASVHCVVTSPPYYGLRDYGVDGQIGLEATPEEFLAKLTAVFREVHRVLRADGTCWVNMGDSYANDAKWGGSTGGKHVSVLHGDWGIGRGKKTTGYKAKDLMGMPWRLAFSLQDDGWYLRQDIIWAKPNPMPESVTDRCTKAHEYLFLLTKSARYFYDADAIREAQTSPDKRAGRNSSCLVDKSPEPRKALRSGDAERFGLTRGTTNESCTHFAGRNKRSVWEIATEAFSEAHFATFPTKLVQPCILAGTSEKGCCSQCGMPWSRATEQYDTGATQKMPDGMAVGNYAHGSILAEGRRKGEAGKPVMATRTIGWEASCRCGADIAAVPCVVLDPFNGSGTTGLVAIRLGRDYVGTELNPAYAAMAEERLRNDRPLFHESPVSGVDVLLSAQLNLCVPAEVTR